MTSIKTITNKAGHTVKLHTETFSNNKRTMNIRVAEEYDKDGKYLKDTSFFGNGKAGTKELTKDGIRIGGQVYGIPGEPIFVKVIDKEKH